ncbi:hypothetical protein MG293_009614 [Ovis ammon polii]|uniref:Uncharacterized protein n=1 Tax=Ovis ammon polii TaxID=230172 RepID=A0AAD4U533_OVIAM|nr:hypothetical protein MG293_009614 [Ovis ammon polii]KAI4568240.1 hypothetical protein MJT46_008038 [Ovis ammon polii x Ovis aries]
MLVCSYLDLDEIASYWYQRFAVNPRSISHCGRHISDGKIILVLDTISKDLAVGEYSTIYNFEFHFPLFFISGLILTFLCTMKIPGFHYTFIDVFHYCQRFCSSEGPVAEMFPLPPSSGPEQELSIYTTTPPGDDEMVPSLPLPLQQDRQQMISENKIAVGNYLGMLQLSHMDAA